MTDTPRQRASAVARRLRVVLVDDHELVRHGLRSLLETTGTVEVVGEADDAARAVEVVAETMPDVVLLDLRLGEQDGLRVAEECRTRLPEVKVLVLSAHGGSQQLRNALASGAEGYLLKSVAADVLVEGLRRVGRGETVIDQAFVPTLLKDIADTGGLAAPLTLREMEILVLVADGASADEAGKRLGISGRTVQKHVENMHRKLGVHSRAELVQQAFRRGLL